LDSDRSEVKHVNCLRPFTPRAPATAVVVADRAEQAEDKFLPLVDWGGGGAIAKRASHWTAFDGPEAGPDADDA